MVYTPILLFLPVPWLLSDTHVFWVQRKACPTYYSMVSLLQVTLKKTKGHGAEKKQNHINLGRKRHLHTDTHIILQFRSCARFLLASPGL